MGLDQKSLENLLVKAYSLGIKNKDISTVEFIEFIKKELRLNMNIYGENKHVLDKSPLLVHKYRANRDSTSNVIK